jgi:hypothetical protein
MTDYLKNLQFSGIFSGPELNEFDALTLKIEARYCWNLRDQTISRDLFLPDAEVYKSSIMPLTCLRGKAWVLDSQEPKTFLRLESARSRNV